MALCSSVRAKRGVRKSALVASRRAIRSVIKKLGQPALIRIVDALTKKGQPLGSKSAVLVGVIAGVTARLPESRSMQEDQKEKIYAFYLREIVGSRSPIPNHLAVALNDFFINYTTISDLQNEVFPQFEKSLLRAPEVVLRNLLPEFVNSLPPSIDLTLFLANNLGKSLLASLKSSNAAVRDGAVASFEALAQRSHEPKALGKATEEILSTMMSAKVTAEQRALHAKILERPQPLPQTAASVCEGMCKLLPKETNETALGSEIAILLRNVPLLTSTNAQLIRSVTDISVKGLEDNKINFRRQWVSQIGRFLYENSDSVTSSSPIAKIEEICLKSIGKSVDEVLANPVAAASTGLAVTALVAAELAELLLDSKVESARSEASKSGITDKVVFGAGASSLLFNPRVYSKLSEADLEWQLRVLVTVFRKTNPGLTGETKSAWAMATIYLIAAADIPRRIRAQAASSLGDLYLSQPQEISDAIITGLWEWYRDQASGKDSTANVTKIDRYRLLHVLQAISPSWDRKSSMSSKLGDNVVKSQLVNMLVLCRNEIIPRANWIELVQRMGQDPGLIASSMASQCIDRISQGLVSHKDDSITPDFRMASCKAAAELAFVAPTAITPLLVEAIHECLPVDEVSRCGPTETAIARTPEGTAFIDVLNAQNQRYVVDKSAPDYETRKWEEEIRNQIAQKKGGQKKLSADDKAKVDAQVVKESKIRQELRTLEEKLRNGIGYVHALATGPPTEAEMWLGSALHDLVDIIDAGATRLVDDAANNAYLACSNLVSLRLGSLRPFIGVATLRALGSRLPANLEQEPLLGKHNVMSIANRIC